MRLAVERLFDPDREQRDTRRAELRAKRARDRLVCDEGRLQSVHANTTTRHDQQSTNASRAHRFILAVAVRMILVGRTTRKTKRPQ